MVKVGDVVVLKSGGPLMTVEQVGLTVKCTWFVQNVHQTGLFSGESLRLSTE